MIGFQYAGRDLPEIVQQPSASPEPQALEDMLKMEGLKRVWQVLQEYMDTRHEAPFMQGEVRDKYFLERLSKIRERFFDKL